jgi:histidine phosphotransferase ChpT
MPDHSIPFPLLEMLSSKICHDLISPIGAINNGLEIMEELGADAGGEVSELIRDSAKRASSKLQAYRIAYGAGGRDAHVKPEDVYNCIQEVIGGDNKITQKWDPHGDLGFETVPAGYPKVLICAILLAMDALPKGGDISIGGIPDGSGTQIVASGVSVNFLDSQERALRGDHTLSDLNPRLIHAAVSFYISKSYDMSLIANESEPERLVLHLTDS